MHKFYISSDWVRLRRIILDSRGFRCERCGKEEERNKLICHHKIRLTEANYSDASISLNPANIELLCSCCHNAEHNRLFTSKQVFIIHAMPFSQEREEYVRREKTSLDIIIDIDAIWKACTGSKYDKPNNAKSFVFYVYDSVLEAVRMRIGKWQNCYIYNSSIDELKVRAMAERLKAKIVEIDSDKNLAMEEMFEVVNNEQMRNLYADLIQSYPPRGYG